MTIAAPIQSLRPFSNKTAQHLKGFDFVPFAGIGLGTITGLMNRFFSASSIRVALSEKNRQVCRNAFSGLPWLPAINGFKQWEIKNIALAAPLIPVVYQIASDIFHNPGKQQICARISTAIRNNVSLEQAVYLTSVAALSLTGTMYCRALGACSTAFDPSGHMMLKIAVAGMLSNVVASTAHRKKSRWTQLFCSVVAAMDAVLIHNTVRSCHTLAETIFGLAWGVGIVGGAKYFSHKLSQRFK
jgi:hypothetical protein